MASLTGAGGVPTQQEPGGRLLQREARSHSEQLEGRCPGSLWRCLLQEAVSRDSRGGGSRGWVATRGRAQPGPIARA